MHHARCRVPSIERDHTFSGKWPYELLVGRDACHVCVCLRAHVVVVVDLAQSLYRS